MTKDTGGWIPYRGRAWIPVSILALGAALLVLVQTRFGSLLVIGGGGAVIPTMAMGAFAGVAFLVGTWWGRRSVKGMRSLPLDCVRVKNGWAWEIDENRKFVYVDPGIDQVLGYKAEELIGQGPEVLVPAEDYQYIRHKFVEVMETPQPFMMLDVLHRHKDGQRISLECSGVPLFHDGRFRGYRGISRNVLDRQMAESALLERAEWYRTVFAISPDAMGLTRLSDAEFVDVNEELLRRSGFDRHEIVGKTSDEIGWWADTRDRDQVYEDLKKHGQVENREVRLRSKDGSEAPVLLSSHIMDIRGEPHVLTIVRDISLLKEAQEAFLESDARMKALLEAVSIGVGVDNLDGTTITANAGLARVLGYTVDELQAMHFTDYTHPDHIEADALLFQELAAGLRKTYQMEKCFIRKDGEPVWCRLTRVLVRDATGNPAYCLGMAEDITDRKRAEESLRESRDNFSKMFRSCPVPMAISRYSDLIVVDANRAWLSFLNFTWSDMVGKTGAELGIWVDLRCRDAFVQKVRQEGSVRNFEAAMTSSDGDRKDVILSAEIIDVGGQQHMLWVIEDISELKRNRDFVHHAQKMKAVGQLTGGVAHDFNNILAVVMTNAECLLDEMDPTDGRRDLIDAICAAADRGADLTGRLLAFSRRQELHPQTLGLNSVIEDVAVMLRRTLGATIDIRTTPSGRSPSIHVDRGQFENALLNLAINARDAMNNQGVLTLSVGEVDVTSQGVRHLTAIPPGRYAVISVGDDGCGMSLDLIERVFDPFFTTKAKGQGTGLGLSMVYGFVRQSGGFIDVESEEGKGTRFDLLFPAVEKTDDAPKTVSAPSGEMKSLLSQQNLFVLLVEDDPAVRMATRRMLEAIGAQVVDASDGEAALDVLETTGGCDLLVTDIVMPGRLNGADLAKAARALIPDLPVVFVSGYSSGRLNGFDLASPQTRFLQKPFKHADIVAVIDSLCGGIQQI